MKKIIMLTLVLILASCSFEIEKPLPEADLTVATANLLISNTELAQAIPDILDLNADIVVLNETGSILEGYKASFTEKGYLFTEFTTVGSPTFYITFLYKENLGISEISYDSFAVDYPIYNMIFPVCRVKINDKVISIVGVHFLPPSIFTKEKDRRDPMEFFLQNIEDGKFTSDFAAAKKDDYVIFTGDFNMFPFDYKISMVKKKGLKDSHINGEHPVNHTWNNFARIDYIFYSHQLNNSYSGTFNIQGSDHRGVIAGFVID
ncbi:MAG: endonuclease/exonuclease/phosphatase family protein [Spirochaetales bacterium]|nr:endonuclease/exonuclease/phosphatase family protein [Spirochaetales bacterium]